MMAKLLKICTSFKTDVKLQISNKAQKFRNNACADQNRVDEISPFSTFKKQDDGGEAEENNKRVKIKNRKKKILLFFRLCFLSGEYQYSLILWSRGKKTLLPCLNARQNYICKLHKANCLLISQLFRFFILFLSILLNIALKIQSRAEKGTFC